MHGIHAAERGRLPGMQIARREDKQARYGFTENRLESIRGGHRGLAFLFLLYLVGVSQRTLNGCQFTVGMMSDHCSHFFPCRDCLGRQVPSMPRDCRKWLRVLIWRLGPGHSGSNLAGVQDNTFLFL